MAEDERTVESSDPEEADVTGTDAEGTAPKSASDAGATADGHTGIDTGTTAESRRTADDAAETFLELDDDLDLTPEPADSDGPRRGLVVDADRIDAEAVPDGYPLSATTDRAVALTVDFGQETTTVYLAWPDDADGETGLTWLLDAMGIELRDLYGKNVSVQRVDGHDVLVTPDERPRGGNMESWVVGGLGAVAGLVGIIAATGGLSVVLYPLWLALTLGLLPYVTYRDAWYTRTHSDWDGGPLFWATLMLLPVLNLFAGVAYLWSRARATFFGPERSLVDRVTATVRDWL